MGILLLSSKRASVTLVFLIVSILVVSTGVVVVHEVKKTNNEVTGTGLVLLDEIQEIEDDLVNDNSNSFVVYDEDSSKDSSKSKKSGKSSGDDLELLSSDSENESLEEDFTNMSSQIFSRNGTDYILRDDKEYILSSSDSKSGEILFSPSLPDSVCVGDSGNEKIDISIQGGFYASGTLDATVYCLYNEYVNANLKLKIMELDFFADDLIAEKTFAIQVNCDDPKVDYSHTFENIDLSLQFTGIGAIEVYGLVELTGYYLKDSEYSTSDYKIDKEPDCQCISGSCCDLSSRPYAFKPDASQPTDYEDYYTCDGTNSPTTTSYCEKRDYYCIGSSSGYTYDDVILDICGICAYCKEDYSSCFFYYQNEYCGSKDCDYLDVTCRDYDDLDKGCSGYGVCSSPDCDSYTNVDEGTSCETNKECDGNGNCVAVSITCSLDSDCGTDEWVGSASCSDDDVYQDYRTWTCTDAGTTSSSCSYDDTATLTQDCGTAGCSDGVCNEIQCPSSVCGGYCESYSNYPQYRFYNSGSAYYFSCSDKTCGYSDYEYCSQGCEDGQCTEVIECSSNDDCGTNAWTGSASCSDDDVYQGWITYTCSNSGTFSSYCSDSTINKKKEECGSYFCNSWEANYCKGDDVYSRRICYFGGCSNSVCYNNQNIEEQKIQTCENGCIAGKCKVKVCETVCALTNCYEYCVWQ